MARKGKSARDVSCYSQESASLATDLDVIWVGICARDEHRLAMGAYMRGGDSEEGLQRGDGGRMQRPR